jgi:hypothetical protein
MSDAQRARRSSREGDLDSFVARCTVTFPEKIRREYRHETERCGCGLDHPRGSAPGRLIWQPMPVITSWASDGAASPVK